MIVAIAAVYALAACAAIDEAAGVVADGIAPPDPVTGSRTLNTLSEESEIDRSVRATAAMIADWGRAGVAVDQDSELLVKLQSMLKRLAPVSHRPSLPWEVHVVGEDTVNAFTIGGGKVFFYSGIRQLAATDDELAAVLAHEMAHNTCRHVTEAQSAGLAAAVSRRIRRDAASAYFAAAYTTAQEDEADRVSLLYLALAGYDPGVVPRIWERANGRWGSDPGNFTYDHSLNADRAKTTAALVPTAREAYAGAGVLNPAFERLNRESALLKRSEPSSGFLALIATVAAAGSSHLATQAEAEARKSALARSGTAAPLVVTGTRATASPDDDSGLLERAIEAHRAGALDRAERAYERVLATHPSNTIALYNLAAICAKSGRNGRAFPLLSRAVDAGFHDVARLRGDPDFAALRGTPKFREIERRTGGR